MVRSLFRRDLCQKGSKEWTVSAEKAQRGCHPRIMFSALEKTLGTVDIYGVPQKVPQGCEMPRKAFREGILHDRHRAFCRPRTPTRAWKR